MSTASFPAAVWLLTLIAGYRARPGSSSRCECCRGCSAVASSKSFRVLIAPGNCEAFADWLSPLRQCEWVVYAKRPFAGPEAVLAYLSRYTHRVRYLQLPAHRQ